MALGLSMGDGNFTPYAKYDARAGRWFTKGADGDIDITDGFTAVFDLETVEVGWMIFASGVAPVYVVQDIALGVPPKPPGDMKQGFKMNIALPSAIAGGGVREVSSTAKSMIGVIDRLHTEYSGAPEKSQGKLPVVKMNGTTVVETKGPSGMTRNYAPNLQIVSWVARPESMPKKQPAAQMFAAAPTYAAPPSTGSTQVPPPVQQAAPAAAMDFG
jgi:hypothetical protein